MRSTRFEGGPGPKAGVSESMVVSVGTITQFPEDQRIKNSYKICHGDLSPDYRGFPYLGLGTTIGDLMSSASGVLTIGPVGPLTFCTAATNHFPFRFSATMVMRPKR